MSVPDYIIDIYRDWTTEQLDVYIRALEQRVAGMQEILREVKAIRKDKKKQANKKLRETGPRGAT